LCHQPKKRNINGEGKQIGELSGKNEEFANSKVAILSETNGLNGLNLTR
jgi:hypothetical protein